MVLSIGAVSAGHDAVGGTELTCTERRGASNGYLWAREWE